ncbi:MAG: histidine kinase [Woeseiaceae bacterium]|jgi:signal transduction histidine kinase|nr:histidine kinase [Woeseiaceae bacterium]
MTFLQGGAAVLTWTIVTVFALYLANRGGAAGARMAWFLGLAVVNLAATLYVFRDERAPLMARQAVHGAGLVAALGAGWFAPVSFAPIYTIIWMAVASRLYPERALWALLAGIVAAWYVIMSVGWGENAAVITAVLYGTFHLFALLTARNAREAAEARDRAEFLNRELIASQHLLSEASRQSERTRIARDLHDLLGHHLTALSINLQIAERLADGEAAAKIAESRALARLLLSDVRDAVSTLRDERAVDFERAVRLLVDKVPQLEIELDIEPGLTIDEFEVAEGLLRCVQEALTNTLRHSGASRSWIRVWQGEDGVHLDIRDDGSRGKRVVEGNGLRGMRERLERLRGSLDLDTVDDALRLRVMIPHPGGSQ